MMTKTSVTRGTTAGVAALIAASALFASIAPAAAVGMPPKPAQASTAIPHAEMMALAEQPLEQAMAYCESRFRSYDRTTGTYLGFDGGAHACP